MESKAIMAFDEILKWSNKQDAEWAKDALRRLARTSGYKPSDADCAKVLERVKHAYGIASDPSPVCTALSADDLPKDMDATERTLLCSIGPVQNIDRLAQDQTLSFALDGITLIYGDNGSGKSGYSRITKKLCRSLTVDPLRGNVFEDAVRKPAEALIRYKTDSQIGTTHQAWIDGDTPPAAIADISVFDSKNARLYVDQENKIQYLPPAIELMEHYSSLLQKLAQQVEAEMTEVKKRTAVPLPTGFTAGSAISKLIEPLNSVQSSLRKGPRQAIPVLPLPTKDALIKMAVWNETLAAELATLSESMRDDPVVKADKHKRVASVLETISTELKAIVVALSDAQGQELIEARKKAETTKTAAEAAASEIFKSEPLPHTGSDAWKLMYKYAKEYAQVAAGSPTEQLSVDGVCVTCQQAVSPEAAERLKKFEDFIADRANTEAESALSGLRTAQTSLKNLKISTKTQIEQQLAEFSSLSEARKSFPPKVSSFVETAMKRRDALLLAIENGDFSKVEQMPASVTATLDVEAIALKSEEVALRKKATDDGERVTEKTRLADLNDQKKLSETIATFTARLEDLQQLDKLKGCKDALGTASASLFITKLRKNLVTDDLQDRISAEIAAFDLNHIPFSVKDRSDGGKSFVGVKLKAVNDVDNKDVLSEGEQRALALACFLGGVLGDPIKHGVIVDDPVSSLDHIRVRKVAERLVKEAAAGRQVVIFTHNVLFYSEVVYAAGQQSPQVPVKRYCIRKDETKGFGIVHEDDEPWIAKDVGKRVDILRGSRLSVLKDRTDTDTDEYRRAVKDYYTDLRETWERFVEEILLGGVVERFNNEVKTQSLKRVIVENDDYQKIFYAMKRVSERSGHDTAAGRTIPTPSYDDMKKDLDELDEFRKEVKKRGDKLQAERKKLKEPPIAKIA